MDNLEEKAFTPMTSIRVLVAVKIFKKHFRAFWARRTPAGGMEVVEMTTKMDAFTQTQEAFTIPAAEIFWGCGNNYQLPQLPSPNLVLEMERLRTAIVDDI
jgi:hypothetical protein